MEFKRLSDKFSVSASTITHSPVEIAQFGFKSVIDMLADGRNPNNAAFALRHAGISYCVIHADQDITRSLINRFRNALRGCEPPTLAVSKFAVLPAKLWAFYESEYEEPDRILEALAKAGIDIDDADNFYRELVHYRN